MKRVNRIRKVIVATTVGIVTCAGLSALYAGAPCNDTDRHKVHTAGSDDNQGTVECPAGGVKIFIKGVAQADYNWGKTTCPGSFKYWSSTEYNCNSPTGGDKKRDCHTDTDAITVTQWGAGTCNTKSKYFESDDEYKKWKEFAPCDYTNQQHWQEDSATAKDCT